HRKLVFRASSRVIVAIMLASNRSRTLLARKGQWPDSGESITDNARRQLDARKQAKQRTEEVVKLLLRRVSLGRIAGVGDFRCPNQYLLIPRDNKNRTFVHSLGVDGRVGRAGEPRHHDMRPANSTDHGMFCLNPRAQAEAVRPRPSSIDNPCSFDAFFLAAELISQQHTSYTSMA